MFSFLPFFFATATDQCDQSGFFDFVPWYHYLPQGDFAGCDIKKFTIFPSDKVPSDVPLVLLAVIDDVLRVAALVALGYLLYGAFLYSGSQGNSEQTSRAQSTLINALVGLAVATTAVAIVSFLGATLGGS